MPRKRTGNILREGDHFVARVLLDGKYVRIHLPPEMSEACAKDRAEFYAENPHKAREKLESQKAQKTGTLPVPKGETFAEYAERWLDDRSRRGLSHVSYDRGVLHNHVFSHLGKKEMQKITREDLEAFVVHCDDLVAQGKFRWTTCERWWSIVRKLFSDAWRSKNKMLRVRQDNPARDIEPPDKGGDASKTFLYPDEFLKLVSCEQVPLAMRRLYAVAFYLYVRRSELYELRWTDFDLVHGTVTISRAWDKERRIVKSTKSGYCRTFAIEANLLPLLRVMHAERIDDGKLFRPEMFYELSIKLRRDLQLAGVTRADLFVRDSQHLPLRTHDSRGTAITWASIRGDGVAMIMERVGHSDYETTQIYIRRADALRGRIGEPFPPLPSCLLDSDPSGDDGGGGGNLSGNLSTYAEKPAYPGFFAQTSTSRHGGRQGWRCKSIVKT